MNLGVRVLAQGNAALARAWAPGAVVEYQNYGLGAAPCRFGLRTLLKSLLRFDGSVVRWLRQYDLVIDTGAGDSFTDIYGIRRHIEMSVARRLVQRARVPLVMGPQTVGPFNTRAGRWLARWSAAQAALVLARDPVSADVAEQMRLPRVTVTTDTVFYLPVPETEPVSRDVLFNVSGLLWSANSHVDFQNYRAAVLDAVTQLVASGRHVTLLSHVLASSNADRDDAAVAEAAELLSARETQVDVYNPTSLDDVRRVIATSRLVVGARMHACLNALSVGTPAIAWAYSRKFRPLLDQLGWTYHVDLNDPAASIAAQTVRWVSELDQTPGAGSETVQSASALVSASVLALAEAVPTPG